MVNDFAYILNHFKIRYNAIEKPIIKPQSIIFPVETEQNIIYFKLLKNVNFEKVQTEVKIVTMLASQGVNVQKYYSENGTIIFMHENYCFYGTYDAGSHVQLATITKEQIMDFIKTIAKMHNALSNLKINTSIYKIESDEERFKEFYIQHKDFIDYFDLNELAENLLSMPKKKLPYLYIHSDLNFTNMMDSSTIIDFTDLKVGYREDDLGKFFQNILNTKFCSSEDLNEYIQIYNTYTNYKINNERLRFSIYYRLFFRLYTGLQENNSEEYLNFKYALKNLTEWEEKQTNDKRSCLQNN